MKWNFLLSNKPKLFIFVFLTSTFSLAETFYVSPKNPQSFESSGTEVWVSNSDCAKATPINQKVIIQGIKPCRFHVYGTRNTQDNNASLRTGVVLNENDFLTLTRCPESHEHIDWSQSPPFFKSDLKSFLDLASRKCHPEQLLASPSFFEEATTPLSELDHALARNGVRFAKPRSSSNNSINHTVFNTAAEVQIAIRQLEKENPQLSSLSSFYNFEFIDSPKVGATLVFDIDILEVSKQKREAYGLHFPKSFHSKNLSFFSSNPEIEIGIEAGQNQGWTQVIAQPRLRAKPGKTASFSSGGELGYTQTIKSTQTTHWKSYGLSLNITPDSKSRIGQKEITLHFELDFSEPDNSQAASGVPSLVKRTLKGEFDLRVTEKTYLTTLQFKRNNKTQNGTLSLSDIPFLGSLFGHHLNNEQDSELWISIRALWEPQT
jgi:hypothetical protein